MEFRELIAKKVTELKPSGIRKFFDLLETMEDAISLGVGEPDFQTPWHIRDAGVYSLEKGFTKYTPNAGMMALRQEIATLRQNAENTARAPVSASAGSPENEPEDLFLQGLYSY